jgi:hypothetical protein
MFRIKGSTSPLVLFSLLAAPDVFHHFIDHKNTHSDSFGEWLKGSHTWRGSVASD